MRTARYPAARTKVIGMTLPWQGNGALKQNYTSHGFKIAQCGLTIFLSMLR
jgi:hypothetical protein